MNQPRSILLELQYFPPVQYFSKLLSYPSVLIEQHEHYVKGSFRNRCHIASVQGVQRLSIPLRKGKNQRLPIREVEIAYDEPWQSQHWTALQSAYGNSPFFDFFADELEPFFRKKHQFLFELNWELLHLVGRFLRLKSELRLTETYLHELPPEALDFRGKILPKHPMEDEHFFPVKYSQVFEDRLGFLPNLSILDLLFCTGNDAMDILERSFAKS